MEMEFSCISQEEKLGSGGLIFDPCYRQNTEEMNCRMNVLAALSRVFNFLLWDSWT